jgi:hypothetical protein
VLYGIDFVTSHASAGAAEATYAASSLGDRLYAFEVGNEPNDYSKNGDEPSTYTYEDFRTAWEGFASAITTSAPGAVMSGPATSGFDGETTWTIPFAADEAQAISLLTQHYYIASGTDPASTISKMLTPDPLLPSNLAQLYTAAHSLGQGFRLTETNSFASGGVVGVSDTFASALWAVDFLLTVAQGGASGVNFHGGKNTYSPIAIDANCNVIGVQPLFYGMLLFDAAANGNLLVTTVTTTASSLTAYVVDENDASTDAVAVNTSMDQSVVLSIDFGRTVGAATLLTMTGPALDSTTGVELGSASIGLDGTWMPTATPAAVSGTTVTTTLAPASAVLVRAQ